MMSSEEQTKLWNDPLNEIQRHKELYTLVEFKSVLAKRSEEKWYNVVTLIKMLQSGNPRSHWKKQLRRNNFVILTTTITMDQFRKIYDHLTGSQVLKLDGYQAHGPFNSPRKDFLDSEQSKQSYEVDWAVNLWRIAAKEDLGMPDSRSLELESENLPFSNTEDVIRYYTGLSMRRDSSIRNTIHIVAPLYYARIRKAELSGRELFVKTNFNLATAKDLRIKYNTEGLDEISSYYKVTEVGTAELADGNASIQLREEAEFATVWLYHVGGFMIDSRRVRRKPSIRDIEKHLSQENPYLWDEDAPVITDLIVSASRTKMPELVTTEKGVDSIDVEVLKAVKTHGGDYADFIPEVLKYNSLDMLLFRLARLRTLGFLVLQPPRKILLTSRGVDAINLPPSVLSAKIPAEIDRRIAEIKSALKEEDYDGVTNKSTRLLECLLREKLEAKFEGSLGDVWPNLKLEPYNRASLGTLRQGCIRLNVFKENSIIDHLIGTTLQLRVPMSHEKKGSKSPSDIAILTVELIEAFIRNWYFLEL